MYHLGEPHRNNYARNEVYDAHAQTGCCEAVTRVDLGLLLYKFLSLVSVADGDNAKDDY